MLAIRNHVDSFAFLSVGTQQPGVELALLLSRLIYISVFVTKGEAAKELKPFLFMFAKMVLSLLVCDRLQV